MSITPLEALLAEAKSLPNLLASAGSIGPEFRAELLNQLAQGWSEDEVAEMAIMRLSKEQLRAILAEKEALAKHAAEMKVSTKRIRKDKRKKQAGDK